ncbi:nuclease-related domain-containing protein [Evansella tamaricis]|uniref:NERD domain-containing protein n=1 Tax=Evansella tamaricis TaxID=2069301 RepID=A0ABS6JA72_9BACI|nr:nuclease-related domain-containing protein [Evansella tamaricis]MBU9710578.1 NERD domain-containing protein [Evansella tamaricis]
MANVHNNGHNDLEAAANSYLIKAIIFFIPTIIYFFMFINGNGFNGIFHLVGFIPAAIGAHFFHKYRALNSGVQGERRAVEAVQQLPSDYDVFRSVKLSTSEGTAELDQIIVSDNGIFVVEVKNHNGSIVGNADDKSWTQHKVGQNGGRYSKQMGNPIRQVKRQVFILSKYLKENGVNAWVEGVVFFSNPKATVNVSGSNQVPVLTSSYRLKSHISDYVPRKPINEANLRKIKSILRNPGYRSGGTGNSASSSMGGKAGARGGNQPLKQNTKTVQNPSVVNENWKSMKIIELTSQERETVLAFFQKQGKEVGKIVYTPFEHHFFAEVDGAYSLYQFFNNRAIRQLYVKKEIGMWKEANSDRF